MKESIVLSRSPPPKKKFFDKGGQTLRYPVIIPFISFIGVTFCSSCELHVPFIKNGHNDEKARGIRFCWFLGPFKKQYGYWAVYFAIVTFFVAYWTKQPLFRPYSFGCKWMNMNVVYWWKHNSHFINAAQCFLVPHFASHVLHGLPWDQLTYCNSACKNSLST